MTKAKILDELHRLQRARFAWEEPDALKPEELSEMKALWNEELLRRETGSVLEVLQNRIRELEAALKEAPLQ